MRTRTSRTSMLLIALTLIPLAVPLAGEPMKEIDRQRLVAHLEMTEGWLADEVKNLSKAQLTFKMTPGSWSIMDVVEHLAIAEPQYWKQVQESMKNGALVDAPTAAASGDKPAAPGDKPAARPAPNDSGVLWYGIDRTRRDRTGEARVPHGQYASVQESLAAFRKLRATMLEYAKTTKEDPRGRKMIEGNMDVYQAFLIISTHAQRHILQIREIKAHAGFPKT